MTRRLAALLVMLMLPTPSLADEAALPLPLVARGQEPGWSVTVTAEGIRYTDMAGAERDAPFVPPVAEDGAQVFSTAVGALRIAPGPCRDAMTGLPHPYRATLERDGQALAGCAGDPDSLLAGDWRAVRLGGADLPEGSEVTLSFAAGRVAGRAACNSYGGSYTLSGEGLGFGAIAATRKACPTPQMETERAVFAAFEATVTFDIGEDGELRLLAADGAPLIEARR